MSESRLPAWLDFKMLIEIVGFALLLGAGYTELKLTTGQLRKDVDEQKAQIEKIKIEYLPRELYSRDTEYMRETLAAIKQDVAATHEAIKRFR
jgi:hypothetical protein